MNPFPGNSTTTGEGDGALLIAIASGKGGTGKTTIAVNLALSLTGEVCLMDCDVEAPNTHLFLGAEPKKTETVYKPVPRINRDLCNGCGECSSLCRYHAIAVLGGKAVAFNELCHAVHPAWRDRVRFVDPRTGAHVVHACPDCEALEELRGAA